jgi:NADH:quinone reductase (non-electrogenic)
MNEPDRNQPKIEREGVAHSGADKTRILVLGGGFAGVEAARYLDRTAAKRANVEVALVSRENFSLFTPMLHEVVASDLEPSDICNPLRKLLRRVTVVSGEIRTINLATRRVTISYGIRELTRELPFDYLVLALGSETSYLGIPGVAEHALGIKTLRDAVMLRAGVIAMLEAASVEPDLGRRKRMLTFVIVGGGFAGVETVGAINDLARQSLRHYGGIDPREVRVILIHSGPVILPELGEALGVYAQEKLRKRQVEIKLKTRITAYADGAVHCNDGEAVPADILVWAGGVSPSPILKDTPFELERGAGRCGLHSGIPRLSGGVGGGRLRSDHRSNFKKSLSSDRPARYSRGPASRQEHLRPLEWRTSNCLLVQGARAACSDRPPHRCCEDLRAQVFRRCGVGTVAHRLPDEIAEAREEDTCRTAMGSGCGL